MKSQEAIIPNTNQYQALREREFTNRIYEFDKSRYYKVKKDRTDFQRILIALPILFLSGVLTGIAIMLTINN